MKRVSGNFIVLVCSLFVSLLICEGILRIIFDEVDILKSEFLEHPALGYVVRPNSAGHDGWGFRNEKVLPHADIVILGDSHTYGLMVKRRQNWPSLLQKYSGYSVYNMGMSAYGPVHYYYLLEEKVKELTPKYVIVTFYPGNDVIDATIAIYKKEYWRGYRNQQTSFAGGLINNDVIALSQNNRKSAPFLNWLQSNIFLFRTISFIHYFHFSDTILNNDQQIMRSLADTYSRWSTRLLPVDLNSPIVTEGLQISWDFFDKLKLSCQQSKITMILVMLPSKEYVYWNYIKASGYSNKLETLSYLVDCEEKIFDRTLAHCQLKGIDYIDSRMIMRQEVSERTLFFVKDMHYNNDGHKLIAQGVRDYFNKMSFHTDD